MSDVPVVSVLMPVYNAEKHLEQALESVINQSFGDIEILAINDGSTDGTESILRRFQGKDSRIHVISRENRGIVSTLNEGIDLCRGRYIARMDADDVCLPDRLKLQVQYLDQNHDVVLLGVGVFRSWRFRLKFPHLSGKRVTTWGLTFHNNVGHPGVMFRSNVMNERHLRYDERYTYAEDFKLWNELTDFGGADVLSQNLLYYRIHPHSISAVHRLAQSRADRLIVMENIQRRFDVDLSSHFHDDVQSWVGNMISKIFHSAAYRGLQEVDKHALHVAFQDYCINFGLKACAKYVQICGTDFILDNLRNLPKMIYRCTKNTASGSWKRLEI